ncbi:MAG TPA: PAS domain S-box protein [Geobacteraceae bacterium]|nr:PAS domain S-box protein [Geobacteraceae bacterium]
MGRKFSTPAFCLTLFLLFSSRLAPAADKPHFAGGDRYIPLHEYIGSPFHMPWLVAAIAALLAASLIWSWLLRREVRIKTSKLRESEEMFRVLAETSTTGIFLYQGEKIIYVNPAMVSILGYSEEEFLGMKFWDWVHEDFREEVKRRGLARQRGENVSPRYECRHTSKNGEMRWIFISAGLIEYRGMPAGLATAFDITDRKRAEESLRTLNEELEMRVAARTAELEMLNANLVQEIETRRKIEDELRLSKDKVQSIVDSFDGLIYICSKDYRIQFMNRGFIDQTGCGTPGEFCYKALHHRDSVCQWCGVAPVFEGRTVRRELQNPDDGSWRYSVDVPLYNTDGTISRLSIVTDITERKKMENELRQANLVVENSPVVLFRCKAAPSWPVEFVSRNVKVFGYTPEEFLSGAINFASMVHYKDLQRVVSELEEYAASGVEQLIQEYRIVTRGGEVRWIIDQTFSERNESGEITHYQGVIIDVTERKRAELALRESEARLKIAMDLAGLAPWEYDANSGLFTFDDQFYALYGTSAEGEGGNLMPMEIYARKFIPSEESSILIKAIEKAQTGLNIQLEHRIIRADGEERVIAVRGEAVFDREGRFFKIRGANQDITERKRAEEQLKQKKKMLEELNSTLELRIRDEVTKNREKDFILIQQNRMAALGEMFDHIAHQWKQPINSIAVIIQALGVSADEQVTGAQVMETVDSIMDILGHMTQTVEVFRNFYKPDKEKTVFLLKKTIDDALLFIMPSLKRNQTEVTMNVDPELSAVGFPKEYAQVLLNILANANDVFRERRAKAPRIHIEACAMGNRAVVTIADNGGGIYGDNIEKIFDLYFTTKESSGGTGIGLYMSRNIIEKNMGGTLSVKNVEGGAQFTIEIDTPAVEEITGDPRVRNASAHGR